MESGPLSGFYEGIGNMGDDEQKKMGPIEWIQEHTVDSPGFWLMILLALGLFMLVNSLM